MKTPSACSSAGTFDGPQRQLQSMSRGLTRERSWPVSAPGRIITLQVSTSIETTGLGVSVMASKEPKKSGETAKPVLLAGGNPQIAKADGDAPVQDYIAAMPGWKRDVGSRLDAIIVRTVPEVRKAVRWNSPFYGIEGQGWLISFHCFSKYVKVTFFSGAALRPVPPGESKDENVRYLDIHEDDQIDEAQLAAWVKQASQLSGWGKV